MKFLNNIFDVSNYAEIKSSDNRNKFIKYFIAFDTDYIHIYRINDATYKEENGNYDLTHYMIDYLGDFGDYFNQNYNDRNYHNNINLFMDSIIEEYGITTVLKAIVDYDAQNGWKYSGLNSFFDLDSIISKHIIQSFHLNNINI